MPQMQLFSSLLVLYILLQPLLALALSPPDSLNITFPQNVTQGKLLKASPVYLKPHVIDARRESILWFRFSGIRRP